MTGVLLMAYGSPASLDEIEPYYTDIRRGSRPPTPLLDELTERYRAIGGASPLLAITRAQAAGMQKGLGPGYQVFVGMRHWTPWIREAVADMQKAGIEQAVGIVMAPHYSSMSVAKYIEKVEQAKKELGYPLQMRYIENWHAEPLFIDALAEKVNVAMRAFAPDEHKELLIVYTAHSLPERILLENDPYQAQLQETCMLVAEKTGMPDWRFAFQSAGRTQEKWLGPDLLQVIREEKEKGTRAFLVCSVGFISDHLEVLYDIDIEARALAGEMGLHLERAGSLNDHPNLSRLFARLVKENTNARY